MDTEITRVTRAEAAELVGVHPRTISRWSAEGLITPIRGGWRDPVRFDREEVLRAAGRNRDLSRLADYPGPTATVNPDITD